MRKNYRFFSENNGMLLYLQLAETIFRETDDEFTVRIAKTSEEIKQLLEVGFEYVVDKDGLMFFRKRK